MKILCFLFVIISPITISEASISDSVCFEVLRDCLNEAEERNHDTVESCYQAYRDCKVRVLL